MDLGPGTYFFQLMEQLAAVLSIVFALYVGIMGNIFDGIQRPLKVIRI